MQYMTVFFLKKNLVDQKIKLPWSKIKIISVKKCFRVRKEKKIIFYYLLLKMIIHLSGINYFSKMKNLSFFMIAS